jgi:hypothetical protein
MASDVSMQRPVDVGEVSDTLVLVNRSPTDVTIESVSVTENPGNVFAVVKDPCTGVALEPGAYCQLTIKAALTGQNVAAGKLTVRSSDRYAPETTAQLSASVLIPVTARLSLRYVGDCPNDPNACFVYKVTGLTTSDPELGNARELSDETFELDCFVDSTGGIDGCWADSFTVEMANENSCRFSAYDLDCDEFDIEFEDIWPVSSSTPVSENAFRKDLTLDLTGAREVEPEIR